VKILVVGGGGREHALAWKLVQSPRVERVWAAPGNPGIARHATCVPIEVDAHEALGALAEREAVDLVVVGPEVPLVAGLADQLRARGLVVFGPDARAARIEGSKAFAKALMARHAIPTAQFRTLDDPDEARAYCRVLGAPVVVKADGLAAGKGAIVCRTLEEADAAVALCMDNRTFGDAGRRIVVEEFLTGEEVSFFAISNGKEAVALGSAQDHKTVFDGDVGPNTGGMGAYVPVPFVDAALHASIMETIVRPTLTALAGEGAPYRGVLYAGLMLTPAGPKVIEFNCRFGDPECQTIMAAMSGDLVPLLVAAARGEPLPETWPAPERAAVCVALASGGYPGRYETGRPITGIEAAEALPGVHVFHAGTALRGDALVTSGGRVLGVTAVAAGLGDAITHAYDAIGRIQFEGMHYRRDIGRRGGAPPGRDARSGRTA
jgi:phosphoribosylamine---glycine ligase